MLLTLLLGVAVIVLLAIAGLAIWELLVTEDEASSSSAPSAATSGTPTPPTLDRQRRSATHGAQQPQAESTAPPPSLEQSPLAYQQSWDEEDEEDMPTVMAFPADFLRDEDEGETVVVNASSYLYELAQLDE